MPFLHALRLLRAWGFLPVRRKLIFRRYARVDE